ncbi:hypothetical protein [Estrella lausannensis]|uniref:Uncharacterized protein n=1 Tax=Estrella lausannensis TaxID=483423 RepID=A0A0H5E6E0_9BACT|nr:hypothetical protein [Estrella lausannensis]CRX38845.1 hypothetical protein ELAC_1517 [Estrella lausannensis]
MAFNVERRTEKQKYLGDGFSSREDKKFQEGDDPEIRVSDLGSGILSPSAEREERVASLSEERVATLVVGGPQQEGKPVAPNERKAKRQSFSLDIEKVRSVAFAKTGTVAPLKESPSQAGSDKEENPSPKLYPPVRKTSLGTPHSASSGSPRTLPRRRDSPKRTEAVQSRAQAVLMPKVGDQSLSRRDSPKDKESPHSISGDSQEERKKRSLSSEGRHRRNVTTLLVLTSSSDSGAALEEHSPTRKKGSVEPESAHASFGGAPEEPRKRAVSAEQKVPRNRSALTQLMTKSEPSEPVSLREVAKKTGKVKEGMPVLDLNAVRGRSLEELKAEGDEQEGENKQEKYFHRALSVGEFKKSEFLYSYREPSSSDSQSKDSHEGPGEVKKRKYLPSHLRSKEAPLDDFDEISVLGGRGEFDKRAKNILLSCLEKRRSKGDLPEVSFKSMNELFKRICARENSVWFMQNKAELSNPHRFLLTESPRSEMLATLFQNSGVLLTPILERLHLMRRELLNYIRFQNKRSPWTTDVYRILCSLTAIERFPQVRYGVEEGIVLSKFLDVACGVLEGRFKNSTKMCIGSAFGDNREEQMRVIAFLKGWSNPTPESKSGLEGEIRDFDWLMMNKGMIPHIKHVCYETPSAPFSISTIEVGEVLRCMKQSDETPVLMNCMTINGELFFDSSKIAYNASPAEMFRALYREAEKNLFVRRVLRSLLFHIVYSSIKTGETETKKKFYNNFKKYFSGEEDEAFLALAMLWMDQSDLASNRLTTFLRAKGLVEEETFSHDFFWRSFEGFWWDPTYKEALSYIYHLLALSSWIHKQESRFMNLELPFGRSKKIFALLTEFSSMKSFYTELFTAFEKAGGTQKPAEEIARDVDVLLKIGTKKNSEIAGLLKEHPLPFLNVLRLTSNSCWGFADQVMRSLYPTLFADPYFAKLKQGMDYHVEIREDGHYEVAILRKYGIYRRLRPDVVAIEGQEELAEIPFYWKVCPHKKTWKGVLKILKSFAIHSKTPAIDHKNILSQLVNYSKKNQTVFAIESNVNDEKRFSYTFDEPFTLEESEGSS